MELRPYHTVALVGRAASRWSAAGPASLLSTRSFSSGRALLQDGDSSASPPGPPANSMAQMTSYMKQRGLQHQQQQQQQRPSIFGPSTTSSAANSALRNPWAAPRQSQNILPRKPQSVVDGDMRDLGVGSHSGPAVGDFDMLSARMELGHEKPSDVKYRLRPVIGRTVELRENVDVARALALLNMKCAVNKVRYDHIKQRRHERPGLKRKRQKSERWRKRFKEGFKATCSRVRVLAKQGW